MINIASPIIGEREISAVTEVLKSGMLAQGQKVAEFEKRFAALCGVKYAVAVNSGTAALHCCTYSIGLKPGDEVITVPFTFVATANPILMQGAMPVFVDIDEKTFNIDPKRVEDAITPKTKAIIAVDLYGQAADYDRLWEIAKRHNIRLIEDAAQSVGGIFKGRPTGSLGHIAAFSFYATKNVITGEGGMVTTDDEGLAELSRRFRHHGQSEQTRYEYYDIGYNYRMTDIMAAIGLAQLERLEEINAKRRKNAQMLADALKGIRGIILPHTMEGVSHAYHQFTIRVTKDFPMSRDELKEYLKQNGFGCGVYYPKPLHLHPHFARLGYKSGDFPVAERLATEVLSLPVHPNVAPEDIKRLGGLIKAVK